jgi:hypothetical protein
MRGVEILIILRSMQIYRVTIQVKAYCSSFGTGTVINFARGWLVTFGGGNGAPGALGQEEAAEGAQIVENSAAGGDVQI